MTPVRFVKMHGAGNDFVVIDRRDAPAIGNVAEFVIAICDRRRGVGADGVLFLDPGDRDLDFRMRYYNRDGGEADLCGNGARCLAAFASAQGLGTGGRVRFASERTRPPCGDVVPWPGRTWKSVLCAGASETGAAV